MGGYGTVNGLFSIADSGTTNLYFLILDALNTIYCLNLLTSSSSFLFNSSKRSCSAFKTSSSFSLRFLSNSSRYWHLKRECSLNYLTTAMSAAEGVVLPLPPPREAALISLGLMNSRALNLEASRAARRSYSTFSIKRARLSSPRRSVVN